MSIIEFIILGLAVFRLTRLFTRDTIVEDVRTKIWERHPPESTKVGYLLTCEWCLSIWIGSLLYLSSILMPTTTSVISTVLALSAIAGLLAAYEDK
jgi:hypothetical protein